MFGKKARDERSEAPEVQPEERPEERHAPSFAQRFDSWGWQFAKVTVFALVAEMYTIAAAAWLCALFYGLSALLGKDRPEAERNPYAPYIAILFLVIGGVGFAFARGWHVMFWQAQ